MRIRGRLLLLCVVMSLCIFTATSAGALETVHVPATPAAPVGPFVVPLGQPWVGTVTNIADEPAYIRVRFATGPYAMYRFVDTAVLQPGESATVTYLAPEGSTTYAASAICEHGFQSEWSSAPWFRSDPPLPTPARPTAIPVLYTNAVGAFTTSTRQGEASFVYDWGNGTTTVSQFVGWWDPIPVVSYAYSAPGVYQVRVKTRDVYGIESAYSQPLPVTVSSSPLMYVSAIGPIYSETVSGKSYVRVPVYVKSQNGAPVAAATVTGSLTLPSSSTPVALSGRTDATGRTMLSFGGTKTPRGQYSFTVGTVALRNHTYAGVSNLVTTAGYYFAP